MHFDLHHIGIATRDVQRSTAFFVRVLGAEVVPSAGLGHTLLRASGLQLALVPWRDGDPLGHAWGEHLALRVRAEERDRLVSLLDELGCPHEDVRGRLYARDADGFTLEFIFESA